MCGTCVEVCSRRAGPRACPTRRGRRGPPSGRPSRGRRGSSPPPPRRRARSSRASVVLGELHVEQQVASTLVVHAPARRRRARPRSTPRRGASSYSTPTRSAAVLGGVRRVGDHHGDGLAGVADDARARAAASRPATNSSRCERGRQRRDVAEVGGGQDRVARRRPRAPPRCRRRRCAPRRAASGRTRRGAARGRCRSSTKVPCRVRWRRSSTRADRAPDPAAVGRASAAIAHRLRERAAHAAPPVSSRR